jgi:hypothetical protein
VLYYKSRGKKRLRHVGEGVAGANRGRTGMPLRGRSRKLRLLLLLRRESVGECIR